jgi:hypothetical protein
MLKTYTPTNFDQFSYNKHTTSHVTVHKNANESIDILQELRVLKLIAAHHRCFQKMKQLGLLGSNVYVWYKSYFFAPLSGPLLLQLMVVSSRMKNDYLFADAAEETNFRMTGKSTEQIRELFCLPSCMEPAMEDLIRDTELFNIK